jgi:hypothetical protein
VGAARRTWRAGTGSLRVRCGREGNRPDRNGDDCPRRHDPACAHPLLSSRGYLPARVRERRRVRVGWTPSHRAPTPQCMTTRALWRDRWSKGTDHGLPPDLRAFDGDARLGTPQDVGARAGAVAPRLGYRGRRRSWIGPWPVREFGVEVEREGVERRVRALDLRGCAAPDGIRAGLLRRFWSCWSPGCLRGPPSLDCAPIPGELRYVSGAGLTGGRRRSWSWLTMPSGAWAGRVVAR